MTKKVYIFNYYNNGEVVDTKVSDNYYNLLSHFKDVIDDLYDDIDFTAVAIAEMKTSNRIETEGEDIFEIVESEFI